LSERNACGVRDRQTDKYHTNDAFSFHYLLGTRVHALISLFVWCQHANTVSTSCTDEWSRHIDDVTSVSRDIHTACRWHDSAQSCQEQSGKNDKWLL